MKTKYALTALLSFLLGSIVSTAQTVDMNDFQGIIGATYRYTGTYNSKGGTLEYRFYSYSPLGSEGTRVTVSFSANNPSDDYSLSMYKQNSAIVRSEFSNSSYSYTMYYDPYWSLVPRFVKVGNSYNSTTNYTYTISGINVFGTIDATIDVVGTEYINLPGGTFEAMKGTASALTTESWDSGWAQTEQEMTIWYVRGVGMVKQQISTHQTSSTGLNNYLSTNIILSYTSIHLPNEPVVPSTHWGKFPKQNGNYVNTEDWMGVLEISNAPWVFSYNEGHYLYIPEETANAGRGWMYSP